MAKILILGIAISLVIWGIAYIIYYFGKVKGASETNQLPSKKGLFAALAAIVLGLLVIYRQSKK